MTDVVKLHNVVYRTKVLGPGQRAAIWFQGCKRSCKGCMSPETRDPKGGVLASISRLCQLLFSLTDLEGITVSGGEPFLQPEALFCLLEQIRSGSSLSIIVYTGYTLAQLRALQDPWVDRILNGYIDVLIDGEYVEALNDDKRLRGSSNQQILFLTDRYRSSKHLFEGNGRNTEVRIKGTDVLLVGVPAREALRKWQDALVATEEGSSPK